MDYITLHDAKTHIGLGAGDQADDQTIAYAIAAASAAIDAFCGRTFGKAASASARIFSPRNRCECWVDDIATTTGLLVKTDPADDGSYGTTISSSDYLLVPPGPVGGITWPYQKIVLVGATTFPVANRRPSVEVTAVWGWPSVPEPVQHACRLLTAWLWKQKDAPLGVAGFGDFGALRVREHPTVRWLLSPYVRPVV